MKKKLTKAEFEALAEALKIFYKADGDNYVLQVVGDGGGNDSDPAELKRALDRVREEARVAKEALAAAEAKLTDDATLDARKKGDIVALEASWNTKLTTAATASQAKIDKLTSQVQKLLVTNVAQKIAADIAGDNAHLIVDSIAKRLTVEYDGDEPKTRVLDITGKPSAATTEELQKEFVADKRYSVIIIASKASGGAESGRKANNSEGGANRDKKFNELTEPERIEWFKRDPEGFKTASKAASQR